MHNGCRETAAKNAYRIHGVQLSSATLDAPNFLYCVQTCDNDVTDVTKFPFTGGQLGARCRETQVMGERSSHVVGTS